MIRNGSKFRLSCVARQINFVTYNKSKVAYVAAFFFFNQLLGRLMAVFCLFVTEMFQSVAKIELRPTGPALS